MMRWLLALLLCCSAAQAQVGLTGIDGRTSNPFVSVGVTAGSAQNATTVSGTTINDCPAGSFMVMAVADYSQTAPGGSVADSAGNTWHAGPAANFNGDTAKGFGAIFYVYNAVHLAAGGSVTYTLASATHTATFNVDCFATGVKSAADPLDTSGSGSGNGTSASVTTSGTALLGDLMVSATFVTQSASSASIGGDSWGSFGYVLSGDAPGTAIALGYNINDANLTTHTNSLSQAFDWVALVAAFKAP